MSINISIIGSLWPKKNAKVCCILLMACASAAAGAVVSVVAEVVTVAFKVLGLAVDSLIR